MFQQAHHAEQLQDDAVDVGAVGAGPFHGGAQVVQRLADRLVAAVRVHRQFAQLLLRSCYAVQ